MSLKFLFMYNIFPSFFSSSFLFSSFFTQSLFVDETRLHILRTFHILDLASCILTMSFHICFSHYFSCKLGVKSKGLMLGTFLAVQWIRLCLVGELMHDLWHSPPKKFFKTNKGLMLYRECFYRILYQP